MFPKIRYKMIPFIDTATEKIIENHISNFDNLIIVLPSQRAGLFLKKKLISSLTGKTSILPKIISVETLEIAAFVSLIVQYWAASQFIEIKYFVFEIRLTDLYSFVVEVERPTYSQIEYLHTWPLQRFIKCVIFFYNPGLIHCLVLEHKLIVTLFH